MMDNRSPDLLNVQLSEVEEDLLFQIEKFLKKNWEPNTVDDSNLLHKYLDEFDDAPNDVCMAGLRLAIFASSQKQGISRRLTQRILTCLRTYVEKEELNLEEYKKKLKENLVISFAEKDFTVLQQTQL